MATKDGFIDFKRIDAKYRCVKDRICDFEELVVSLNEEELKRQAARCMGCDIPFCFALGCPLKNHIPEINDHILRKEYKEAYNKLSITNPFPEITGRICPALCEYSCSLSLTTDSVSIKQLELYIAEKAFDEGLVYTTTIPKKNKSVGIVGSGPSGLAAASELIKEGFDVTVYEKKDQIGGLLRYGIPNYKLPKWILDRRISLMKDSGVDFITNMELGKNITIDSLAKLHDYILFSIGAGQPRDLAIKGRELEGIHFAMDYLGQSIHKDKDTRISALNKEVLVIGGGDTGSDCIGTAIRQGAKSVHQIEIMPKPYDWDFASNPEWPNYPRFNRISSSHEEGCKRDFSVKTISFISDNGKLRGASCIKVDWEKKNDGSISMVDIEGSEFTIEAELILIAMGFVHLEHLSILKDLGVKYDSRGNVSESSLKELKDKNIFICGDALTGASLVVKSIKSGIDIAKEIISQ